MFKSAAPRFAVSTCLGTLLAAGAAQAQALPPAVSSVLCSTSVGNITDPVACNTSNDHAQVTLAPAPSLWVAGDFPGNLAIVQAGATAQLSYSFAVIGGQFGDLVHLDVTTLLHWATQGSPNAYAFTRVIVTTGRGEVTANICTLNCGPGSGVTDFFGDLHVDATSGAINTVAMDVSTFAAFSQNANTASAYADPMISIDPRTPNAGAYTLLFSDGVGNAIGAVPGVPEPAVWALMLAGCGVLGLRARRVRIASD